MDQRMKQLLTCSLLTLASLFLFCGQANAAMVYSNGTSTTHTTGWCSDCGGAGVTAYDDFTLTDTTTITGIEWDAAYLNSTDTSNDIIISFSTAVGSGLIASSTHTWSDVLIRNNTIGTTNSNSTFFASLPSLVLNANTYYLSIYSHDHFMPMMGGDGLWQVIANDTHFQDVGYIPFRLFSNPNGNVPVPATLVLISLGLLLLGANQRRK